MHNFLPPFVSVRSLLFLVRDVSYEDTSRKTKKRRKKKTREGKRETGRSMNMQRCERRGDEVHEGKVRIKGRRKREGRSRERKENVERGKVS